MQTDIDQVLHVAPPESDAGTRIDRWLATQLPARSRSEIQRWIKEKRVLAQIAPPENSDANSDDGDSLCGYTVAVKASHRVEAGQRFQIRVPPLLDETDLVAEDIPLDVCFDNEDLLVVNKSAGMVVHPAAGHPSGTLVNAILYHYPQLEGIGGQRRPGIVHRLDKDTSGLIIIAKNDRAHRALQAQFQNRQIFKEYLALVEGRVEPPKGRITAPIGRHPTERKRQAVLSADPITGKSLGRDALTEYHLLESYSASIYDGNGMGHFSLVRVVLHTGRTHQIRVHFAWLKHPVVGDRLYGYRKQRLMLARQFLHAHRLRFQLPQSQETIELCVPLPTDLAELLASLHDE